NVLGQNRAHSGPSHLVLCRHCCVVAGHSPLVPTVVAAVICVVGHPLQLATAVGHFYRRLFHLLWCRRPTLCLAVSGHWRFDVTAVLVALVGVCRLGALRCPLYLTDVQYPVSLASYLAWRYSYLLTFENKPGTLDAIMCKDSVPT